MTDAPADDNPLTRWRCPQCQTLLRLVTEGRGTETHIFVSCPNPTCEWEARYAL